MSCLRRLGFALALLPLALFAIFAAPAPACATQTLTIRADEWCPYNCTPDSDKPGYMIEVLQAIFEPQGVAVEYANMPWARALDSVGKGRFAAVVGAGATEAEGFVYPSEPFGFSANSFFTRAGESWQYTGMDSLADKRVGVILDYEYSPVLNPYFESQKASGNAQFASGNEPLVTNIKKLVAGRVDVIIDDKNVVQHTAADLGMLQDIRYAGNDINPSNMQDNYLYVAFSPAMEKSAEWARMFDEGIARMRADGTLNAILARYGLEDWK